MTKPWVIPAGVLIALTLTGCIPLSSGMPASPVTTGPARSAVPWEDYAPDLQGRIDSLQADIDCVGLQEQFDSADANSGITMDRTGHNNADLMAYISEALELAGCYS
jgi:hypothetical protein